MATRTSGPAATPAIGWRRPTRAAAIAIAAALMLVVPAAAHGASVAYLEGGNVWLASPDGTKKVQLTTDGTAAKPWLGVAQAPDGRTAAVYNTDLVNANPRLQWMKVWDRSGAEIRNLPLQSRSTPNTVVRPLAFEISDDGDWTANEYSYCTGFGITYCQTLPHGTWYTLTTTPNVLDALDTPGFRQGTFFGNQLISSDGTAISVQKAAGAPATTESDPWITPGAGYALKRADVPATGGKVAVEGYQAAPPAGQPNNVISILPYAGAGVGGAPDPGNGCDLPASGNAHSVAWSPDGSQIAWRDDQGLKVAGTPILPSPTDNVCKLASPPVVITSVAAKDSADRKTDVYLTTSGPSFGGADVAAILAARRSPTGSTPGTTPGTTLRATLPKSQKAAALTKGMSIGVTSAAAGRIDVVATIPAKTAKRLKIPATIARGRLTAKRAGQQLTLRLKLGAKAKRKARRLKGVFVTVTITQGTARTTLRVKLR